MSEKAPKLAINPPVFFVSGGLLIAFLIFGALFGDVAGKVLPAGLDWMATHFGWFYTLGVGVFLTFALWMAFSRVGNVRLGDDDTRPDFGRLTWFSMLFSAGMGIGLLFYGVAEPMMHYVNPPLGQGQTQAAAELALPRTFFHWGLHAWAIYVCMGLAIAYFAYRKKLPIALRSTFYPLLGERIHGWAGHIVDILAVLGTLFGLATSLGLGAMQVNAGLNHLFDVPMGTNTQLVLIAVITGAATISLVTGVDKGIRRLSELNMILALLLLLFVFFVGPTVFILDAFSDNVGRYLGTLVAKTFWTDALRDNAWIKNWTLFYWGWWIAWSPFVGMFVARISRGRTVREFVLGVLLVPTLVTFIWMTVFGDTALYLERFGEGGIAQAVDENVATAIYVMLSELPLSQVTSLLAAGVVAVFFVTSSDSASFVVDMLTSGGHPNPPIWQRVFWAVAEGAVAAVLLATSGQAGLSALQSGVICIGVPFCLVLLVMCYSLGKSLLADPAARARPAPAAAAREKPPAPSPARAKSRTPSAAPLSAPTEEPSS